jgi:DNA-binding transcriptional ArsR family regulator
MGIYMTELETLCALFQTLADINRLRIIYFLGQEERSVNEVVKALKLSQPLVSHHLKVLKQVSIVNTTREGPFVLYRLSDKKLTGALNRFLSGFEERGEKERGAQWESRNG